MRGQRKVIHFQYSNTSVYLSDLFGHDLNLPGVLAAGEVLDPSLYQHLRCALDESIDRVREGRGKEMSDEVHTPYMY